MLLLDRIEWDLASGRILAVRLGSMRRLLGLVVALSGGLHAGRLGAQVEEPFATWNRYLVEHRMGVPAAAEWLANAVKPLGEDAVPKLRRYVEEPMLALERLPAALVLKRYGIHHLEPALRSPRAEVRNVAATALIAPIQKGFIPSLVTQAAPGTFDVLPYAAHSPVTDFLDGIMSEDAKERTLCLAVLRCYRPPGDVAYHRDRTTRILEALGDKDPRIRAGAAVGLAGAQCGGLHRQVFERLRKARTDRDARVRAAVFEAAQWFPVRDNQKAALFAEGLEDPDDRVVTAAAEGIAWLSQYGRPALPALIRAARDDHAPYAKAAILRAIMSVRQPDAAAVEVVRASFTAPEPEVRRAALHTIGWMGLPGRAVIEEVRPLAIDAHPFVRAAAISALAHLGDRTPAGIRLVVDAMDDSSPTVRACAFTALWLLMPEDRASAATAFARGLTDPAYRVRCEAVRALGAVGPAARPHAAALVERLEDPVLRDLVRKTLRTLGVGAVPALMDRLSSGKAKARADVVGLLGSLGQPALKPVASLLDNEREDVRSAAASALAWMGPVARPAELPLIELTASGSDALAPIGAWALYRINTAGPRSPALVAAAGKHRWCAWALIQAVRFRGCVGPAVERFLRATLGGDDAAMAEAAADAMVVCGVDPKVRSACFADPGASNADLIERVRTRPRPERMAAMRTLLLRAIRSPPEDAAIPVRELIGRIYGLEVVGAPPPPAAGKWWNLPEMAGNATALSADAMRDAGCRLALALAAYPAYLVHAHVKRIMLLHALRIYNTRYGGTYRGTTLYLAAGARPDRNLVAAFHHEFSSLLLRARAFPEKAWRAVHGPAFAYGNGGVSAIRRGHTGEGCSDLHALGFFKPYGRADLENDFNVFSETVMTYPLWAAAIARRHPRLAAKGRLWQEHLTGLDPTFVPPVRFPPTR